MRIKTILAVIAACMGIVLLPGVAYATENGAAAMSSSTIAAEKSANVMEVQKPMDTTIAGDVVSKDAINEENSTNQDDIVIKENTQQEQQSISDSQNSESDDFVLSLDSKNQYEGMTMPYKKGYTPTIQEDKVIIILPLENKNTTGKDTTVTASVDLGSTTDSPFVYKNYQKEFKKTKKEIIGTGTYKEIYYIRFDLQLSKNRWNGTYPVGIQVTPAEDHEGAATQNFTIYVTISDGKRVPESSESVEEKPTSAPVVVVSSYKWKEEKLEAGKTGSVIVTLTNTSKTKAVQNMVVQIVLPDKELDLQKDSSTIYIEKLGKQSSLELELQIGASHHIQAGQYVIELQMSYDDAKANTHTSTGSFPVVIVQPLQVEMTIPQIPKEVTAGDNIPVEFQVLNLGRSKAYNVRVGVQGQGITPTKTAFIGDMEGASEGTASIGLFVGTLEGTEKYGLTEGTITLLYEDEFENTYTQTDSFEIRIKEPVIEQTDEVPEKTASQWWITMAVLGIAFLLIGSSFVFYHLGRKNR